MIFIKKHNFHPKDVIHDLELIGGEVFHFDGDLRDYVHEIDLNSDKKTYHQDKGYFSIGEIEFISQKNIIILLI